MSVCSVALPVLIVIWSVTNAMSGKPFGACANEVAYFPGALKNGEMWHWVLEYLGKGINPGRQFHLRRLNLETGAVLDTGIVTNLPMNPIWIGDELYAFSNGMLLKQEGKSFVPVAPLPPNGAPPFFVRPFPHNGRIASLVQAADGSMQLVELVNGEWTAGQKVDAFRLPTSDEKLDQPGPFGIRLVEALTDQETNGAAVGSTGNRQMEPIQPTYVHGQTSYRPRFTQYFLTFDKEGPLISTEIPRRVLRQKPDGSWKRLNSADESEFCWYPQVIADPSEPVTYLFEDGNQFSSSRVRRIVGDEIQPIHLVVRGKVPEYLGRWKQIALGLCIAWLVHLTMLVLAISLLASKQNDSVIRFGHQQAILAPLWRRGLGLVIDLAIGMGLPILFIAYRWVSVASDGNSKFEFDLCDTLYEYEEAITGPFENGFSRKTLAESVEQVIYASNAFLKALPNNSDAMRTGVWGILIFIVVAWLARTYCEARFGVTPGKWLLGIRTVRSTFRPCGFARSLLRSTLYCLDIPLLLTPIPAVMSVLRSPLRQRLGDRIADTVVIQVGSVVDAKSEDNRRDCDGFACR